MTDFGLALKLAKRNSQSLCPAVIQIIFSDLNFKLAFKAALERHLLPNLREEMIIDSSPPWFSFAYMQTLLGCAARLHKSQSQTKLIIT